MGDHKDDKPYEQLIEEAQQEKARKLAEAEAEQRSKEERERLMKQRQEEEKLSREKATLEMEKRKKDEEAQLYASVKQAKLEAEKLERERKEKEYQMKEIAEKEKRLKEARDRQEQEIRRREKERARELYQKWKQQAALRSQADEKESKEQDERWKVQLRRSKKADKDRSAAARRARDSLRQSGDYTGLKFADIAYHLHTQNISGKKPALPPKPAQPRADRPKDRLEVVTWFKETEVPRGAGMEPGAKRPAEWFHGIIARQQAEELLSNRPIGSFLVRVSERVWGYTLSYVDGERVKHFLIDTSDATYQFFGANQIAHLSLCDLVNYHKNNPISEAGQEYLRASCGQVPGTPDYAELFRNDETLSTSL
ncbi:SH2 domain-containing protein 4A-like isoform X2 [Glandiceps talaboti]